MGLACFGLLWLAVGLGLLSLAVRLGLLWLGLLGFTSDFRVGGLLAWLQFRVEGLGLASGCGPCLVAMFRVFPQSFVVLSLLHLHFPFSWLQILMRETISVRDT